MDTGVNMEDNNLINTVIKENRNTDLFELICNNMELDEIDVVNYSPLTLAYIGDAVFELIIRTIVVVDANKAVNKLHKESANLVKADAQCKMAHSIREMLTEDEIRIFKRGRNAKSYTKAKNASYSDYRHATGFEALIGYLYLSKKSDRLMELVTEGLKAIR